MKEGGFTPIVISIPESAAAKSGLKEGAREKELRKQPVKQKKNQRQSYASRLNKDKGLCILDGKGWMLNKERPGYSR